MVSTIIGNGLVGQMLKGFGSSGTSKSATTTSSQRGDDTISLSPESLALQDSIRQNGEAAASMLAESDVPTSDTAQALHNLIA